MSELLATNKKFARFCHMIHDLPESSQQTLESFLIKPFQRLSQYNLLLQQLAKNTSNVNPEREHLRIAANNIDSILKSGNEVTRETDRLVQMAAIQSKFALRPGMDIRLFTLHKYKLVRHGALMSKHLKTGKYCRHHLFVFNELIIVAEALPGGKLQPVFFPSFRTLEVSIGESPDTFLLTFQDPSVAGTQVMEFTPPPEDHVDRWVSAFNSLISLSHGNQKWLHDDWIENFGGVCFCLYSIVLFWYASVWRSEVMAWKAEELSQRGKRRKDVDSK